MVFLPAPSSRGALEWADYVGGNPTPVEVPFLRLDLLPPNPASIHLRRIERHVIFEGSESRHRVRIRPGDPLLGLLISGDIVPRCNVVVAGAALPFAMRSVARLPQELHLDVLRQNVIHGWVARLEDAFCPRGVGERDTAEDDLDLLAHVLDPRRTRIIPDGLLSLTWIY